MPLLDVTEILIDPDLADTFSVIRTTTSTNSSGIASSGPARTYSNVVGVITWDDGTILERAAEGVMIKGRITICTKFILTDGDQLYDADQIVWNGNTYTVSKVDSYSRFGPGFVCAYADLKPVNPPNSTM